MGAASPMQRGHNDDDSASNTNIVYSEDEDENDELYIDPGTKQNNGVSTHIMYVHALCFREVQNYHESLKSYAKIMKLESQIGDYEKMIDQENFKNLDLKNVDGPGTPGWLVDIYSHFNRHGLLKANDSQM